MEMDGRLSLEPKKIHGRLMRLADAPPTNGKPLPSILFPVPILGATPQAPKGIRLSKPDERAESFSASRSGKQQQLDVE